MSNRPRVSFIVTCYNYGHFVGQAIDSLLDQTFESLEIIVIDDASTDETAEVLARYGAEPKVRVIHHERNQGHIRSYNEGLALAEGEYLGILSADDYCLRRNAVARQVAIFDEHPSVGMVYAAYALVEEGRVTGTMAPSPEDYAGNGLDEFRRLMWGNYILHSGTLLRRQVQNELGPYDAGLPQAGDWDLWLRAAAGHDVGYVAEPLYAYRQHRQNMQAKGLPPCLQAEQNLRTLERAFAMLASEAPADIKAARDAALRHAVLQTAWYDLFNGRRARARRGLAYALKRRPSLLLTGELWRFLLHLGLLTAVGREPYRQAIDRLRYLRRRSRLTTVRFHSPAGTAPATAVHGDGARVGDNTTASGASRPDRSNEGKCTRSRSINGSNVSPGS